MKNVFAVAIIFIATYIAAIAGKEPATVKFAKATGIFSFAPAPKSDIALGIDARGLREAQVEQLEEPAESQVEHAG